MKSQSDFSWLIDAQKEIADYWTSKSENGLAPVRSDIDPGALRAHLHCLSILELDGRGGATFRLVGTQLRHLIGADMRGCKLSDLPDRFSSIWRAGGPASLLEGQPGQGITDIGDSHHAWLRLPLRLNGGDHGATLLLCHDVIRCKKPRESRPVFSFHPTVPPAIAA